MKKLFALAALAAAVTLPVSAQVKVGIITGATGPGASLGIPYKNTFSVVPKTLGGQPVQYIVMDDATDPTNAVKLARKLDRRGQGRSDPRLQQCSCGNGHHRRCGGAEDAANRAVPSSAQRLRRTHGSSIPQPPAS